MLVKQICYTIMLLTIIKVNKCCCESNSTEQGNTSLLALDRIHDARKRGPPEGWADYYRDPSAREYKGRGIKDWKSRDTNWKDPRQPKNKPHPSWKHPKDKTWMEYLFDPYVPPPDEYLAKFYSIPLSYELPVPQLFQDLDTMHVECGDCPRVYYPVCDTLNNTYVNPCVLNCFKKNSSHLGVCIRYRRTMNFIAVVVPITWVLDKNISGINDTHMSYSNGYSNINISAKNTTFFKSTNRNTNSININTHSLLFSSIINNTFNSIISLSISTKKDNYSSSNITNNRYINTTNNSKSTICHTSDSTNNNSTNNSKSSNSRTFMNPNTMFTVQPVPILPASKINIIHLGGVVNNGISRSKLPN